MTSYIISILFLLGFGTEDISYEKYPMYSQSDVAEVVIKFYRIENNKGQIIVSVYDGAEGFPKKRDPLSTHAFSKSAMRDGKLTCRFHLAAGKYAFAILDDENMDEQMRYNIAGLPREGFGFSNNPSVKRLRSPSFEKCCISLKKGRNYLSISMNYLF